MAIIAKSNGNSTFKPAPAGTYQAVCADIVDLGMVKSEWQGKERTVHKIRIYWLLDEVNPEIGKPYLVTKTYNLSLNEKATLRKDLEAWRGVAFTDDELDGFDVEKLIGVNCMVGVVHNKAGENTYANVASLAKIHKSMSPITVGDYIRKKDRPSDEQQNGGLNPAKIGPADQMINDDDIPF